MKILIWCRHKRFAFPLQFLYDMMSILFIKHWTRGTLSFIGILKLSACQWVNSFNCLWHIWWIDNLAEISIEMRPRSPTFLKAEKNAAHPPSFRLRDSFNNYQQQLFIPIQKSNQVNECQRSDFWSHSNLKALYHINRYELAVMIMAVGNPGSRVWG